MAGSEGFDLKKIDEYYSERVKKFGTTPAGVDWNSAEGQDLRFEMLGSRWSLKPDSKVLDYGCGYGALKSYLDRQALGCKYYGFDISNEMLQTARDNGSGANCEWLNSIPPDSVFDYVIASGTFNVKLDYNNDDWLGYIVKTCDQMWEMSAKGMAFNLLTAYSDKPFQKNHLFYANPADIFDKCMRKYSRRVALLHDYPLYEFTIVVDREDV